MAKIYSLFTFTPLYTALSIDMPGGVAPVQTADSIGALSPDYSLTPLTLQPVLSVRDPDTGQSIDNDMEHAASIKWEEIKGTKVSEIKASTPGYSLTASGANKGRLQRTANLDDGETLTLRVTVIYVDPRTSDSIKRVATCKVSRRNSASARPRLRLNVPRSLVYNPLRDKSDITLRPMLTGVARAWKPPVNCGFIYEKYIPASRTWRRVLRPGDTGYDIMDYDVTVAEDTSYAIVHREMMGDNLRIRCRAWYLDAQTNTPVGATSASYAGVAPEDEVLLERTIPRLNESIHNVGWRMGNGTRTLMPKAVISDTDVIDDLSELRIAWKAGMAGALKSVGEGQQVSVAVPLSQSGSFAIEMSATDRGPWKALADAGGKILTTADGKIIIAR